jgi:hypothetical protein
LAFVFRPTKRQVDRQLRATGNPPVDKVLPFNYPYLLRDLWQISPVRDNIYKITLQTPITLTGGVDDNEYPFFFHHEVIDFHWFQEDAAGARNNDALTWEWARRFRGDWLIMRATDADARTTVTIRDERYRTDTEEYRFRFEGTATNVVTVQMWIEVNRI